MNIFTIIGLFMAATMYAFPVVFLITHQRKTLREEPAEMLVILCPFLNFFITIGFIKFYIERKMSNLKNKRNARKRK